MWWRFLYGLIKTAVGIFLLFYVHNTFLNLFNKFFALEIIEDPHDKVITVAQFFINHNFSVITYFIAFYFIFWGIVDIILSINLLKHRYWSYPVSTFLISIFLIYEVYRFTHTHSKILFFVIVTDFIVIWLIKKEFQRVKKIGFKSLFKHKK